MENPSKTKKFDKIVGGALIADEDKNIDIPAKKSIVMSTEAMFLNGEMNVNVGSHTAIRDNERIVARVDNKYPKILVSKKLIEKDSIEAVKKYMKEKDIKSIADIIKGSDKQEKDSYIDGNNETLKPSIDTER